MVKILLQQYRIAQSDEEGKNHSAEGIAGQDRGAKGRERKTPGSQQQAATVDH